jgi:hypothetical protein
MIQNKSQSTDHDILRALPALRRAAVAARRLSEATGTPFYVMKNERIIDLNARRVKRHRKTA